LSPVNPWAVRTNARWLAAAATPPLNIRPASAAIATATRAPTTQRRCNPIKAPPISLRTPEPGRYHGTVECDTHADRGHPWQVTHRHIERKRQSRRGRARRTQPRAPPNAVPPVATCWNHSTLRAAPPNQGIGPKDAGRRQPTTRTSVPPGRRSMPNDARRTRLRLAPARLRPARRAGTPPRSRPSRRRLGACATRSRPCRACGGSGSLPEGR
jgi:hypothetical protein